MGEASFAALTGAPVLLERVRARSRARRLPRPAAARHEPLSHLELVANADVYLIAPASANTIAKLAAGLADNLLCSCALAAGCPLVVAPAMNNQHVRAPGHAGQPAHAARARRARSSSPGVGGWPPRARRAWGAWPSPRSCWRPARRRSPETPRPADGRPRPLGGPERARHRGRHARADRQRALRRQQLLRADGPRARARGARARRAR